MLGSWPVGRSCPSVAADSSPAEICLLVEIVWRIRERGVWLQSADPTSRFAPLAAVGARVCLLGRLNVVIIVTSVVRHYLWPDRTGFSLYAWMLAPHTWRRACIHT